MGSDILFHDANARARRQTLMTEAEQTRRHHAAWSAARLPVGAVRQSIGAMLIRAGEIVRGPRFATQAA